MEPGRSNHNGGNAKCEKEAKEAPRGVAENIARLDEVRRVARRDRARLFLRAVPTTDYLRLLSEAGVLQAPAVQETSCHLDAETGEAMCNHAGDPGKDCRQSWCRYAVLMRMRLFNRLGAAYARERNRLGVVSY